MLTLLDYKRPTLALSLAELTELNLCITNEPGDHSTNIFLAAMLTQEAPRLTQLSLSFIRTSPHPVFDIISDISRVHQRGPWPRRYPKPVQLSTLELDSINLCDRNFGLYPWININELTSLKLSDCARIEPFLWGCAQLLQNSTTTPLRVLHVKHSVAIPSMVADPMPAIEAVLRAAKELEEIFISANHNTLPAKDCITKHGKSLRILLVNIGERQNYSRPQTVATLNACPALEQLGIRLPRFYLGSGDNWKRHWTLRESLGITRTIRGILVSHEDIETIIQFHLDCV
jgi:hypothetical protein